jgi:Fe-S-cluster containining protein
VNALFAIQNVIDLRVRSMTAAHEWPCRKGCDECCRRLAEEPRVTADEWNAVAAELDRMPSAAAEAARSRIRQSAGAQRPVVCPLLDATSGACLVYSVRPVACRTYGFYVEREKVLGCSRIVELAERHPDVIWGNHLAIESELEALGNPLPLSEWLCQTKPNLP